MSTSINSQKELTSIIIAVSNTDYPVAHYTGNCIGSIKYFTKEPYEIIVVDNGSTVTLGGLKWDKTVDEYIKNEKNEGVSKAWNQGIMASQGKYICIMNSDIQVFKNWLGDLLQGLIEGEKQKPPTKVVTATPMYDLPFGRAQEAWARRYEWLDKKPDQYLTDFQDFSCVLFRKSLMDEVGLFDENYGIGYGEDIDFKFRVKKAGYAVKSSKRCNIHHVGMATTYTLGNQKAIDTNKIMNRNKEYTAKKWDLDEHGVPGFLREQRGQVKKEELKKEVVVLKEEKTIGYHRLKTSSDHLETITKNRA